MKLPNRFALVLLVITLALLPALIPVQAQSDPDDDSSVEYIPGEVVMRLADPAALNAVAAQFSLILESQFGAQAIYRMTITDGSDPEQKAVALRADARVVYAEPNYLSAAPESQRRGGGSWAIGGDDGSYAEQWAPATIRLPEAHARTRGAGTIVAILDTGVDPTHPALAGRLLPGYDFVDMDADPSETGQYSPTSAYGHGTHVAGLVALVAPEAQILPVRVLDPDGVGNIWVLAEALDYAVQNGADVINLSLGTLRRTDLLDELIRSVTCADDDDDDDDAGGNDDDDDDAGGNDDDDDDAGGNDDDDDNGGDSAISGIFDDDFCDDDDDDNGPRPGRGRGVVVIAAAGNGGNSVPQYPAAEAVPGSLAIAATTRADALAAFSTRGAWVTLAAPGEQIISSVPLASGAPYGVWSGSSMAAPLVAGAAALVRAQEPLLSAVDVADRLVAAGACIDAPMPRLDAAAALNSAGTANACNVYLPLLVGSS